MIGRYIMETGDVVEALQFTGNFDEVEQFVGGDAELRDGKLVVATLRGPLAIDLNAWIVRDKDGNFYECAGRAFGNIYKVHTNAAAT